MTQVQLIAWIAILWAVLLFLAGAWFLAPAWWPRRALQGAGGVYLAENLVQGGLIYWRVLPPNAFLIGTLLISSAVACWWILRPFRRRARQGGAGTGAAPEPS